MKIDVSGETKVFVKEFNGKPSYSTSIGKKKQDGTWDNAYINLQFMKGIEIADGTKIDIQKGWLTFYINKENKPVWQIFVMEFESEDSNDIPKGSLLKGFEEVTSIEDDDDEIPF